jgi:hypothetical protein
MTKIHLPFSRWQRVELPIYLEEIDVKREPRSIMLRGRTK